MCPQLATPFLSIVGRETQEETNLRGPQFGERERGRNKKRETREGREGGFGASLKTNKADIMFWHTYWRTTHAGGKSLRFLQAHREALC